MSENIKEKTTKAFKVDLDSKENQNILKPMHALLTTKPIKLMKRPKRFMN